MIGLPSSSRTVEESRGVIFGLPVDTGFFPVKDEASLDEEGLLRSI